MSPPCPHPHHATCLLIPPPVSLPGPPQPRFWCKSCPPHPKQTPHAQHRQYPSHTAAHTNIPLLVSPALAHDVENVLVWFHSQPDLWYAALLPRHMPHASPQGRHHHRCRLCLLCRHRPHMCMLP